MSRRDMHSSYAFSPIIFSCSPKVTVTSCVHILNVRHLITLPAGGITMSSRDSHPQNAPSPIQISTSPRTTVLSCMQLLNALFLITWTAGEITTSCSDVHSANLLQPLAKSQSCQLRAELECPIFYHLGGRGDYDVTKRFAITKCMLPNLLKPLTEDHSGQLPTFGKCLVINDGGWDQNVAQKTASTKCHLPISSRPSLKFTLVNYEQPLNALALIALTEGGIEVSQRDVQSRNAPSPTSSSRSPRFTVFKCKDSPNASR